MQQGRSSSFCADALDFRDDGKEVLGGIQPAEFDTGAAVDRHVGAPFGAVPYFSVRRSRG